MIGRETHSTSSPEERLAAGVRAWLAWHALMGVDDPTGLGWAEPEGPSQTSPVAAPVGPASRTVTPAPVAGRTSRGPTVEREGVGAARRLARSCRTLDELRRALETFEGCALRQTATRLCFADGNPEARIMLIGEAPGSEEDRQGRPFVGPSGQLLDRMLATIGLDRRQVWITNVIFWRPPGNRAPTAGEIAVCQPFLERQIELLAPAVLVFVGGIAARALLGLSDGVTRLRGRRLVYRAEPRDDRPAIEIPAMVIFHPAYLLRQPLNKRFAWRDLLTLRSRLDELGVAPGVAAGRPPRKEVAGASGGET
jgi:DNA polymerase